jgi:GNAT superfamily N-acetyltransferase
MRPQPHLPSAADSHAAERIERDAWLDFFAAAPRDVQTALGLSSGTIGTIGLLGSRAVPITELNRAVAVGGEPAPSLGDLAQAAAWLDRHAAPDWSLQVAPDAFGGAVAQFCIDAGLTPHGPGWAKFVRPLVRPLPEDTAASSNVRLATPVDAGLFGDTLQRGFGLPPACAGWFGALVGRPGWHCFIAVDGATPIAGAATFVAGAAAWSGMSATLPDHRRRGTQRALIRARIAAATAAGATLYTSETAYAPEEDRPELSSFRNQQRAGATLAYVRPNWRR